MTYEIYETELFSKVYKTADRREQIWIDKIKQQLICSPTGKTLQYTWIREKKFGNKRLYFIVDEETKQILLVSFGSKKDQQTTIDFIIHNKNYFLELLKKQEKKLGDASNSTVL